MRFTCFLILVILFGCKATNESSTQSVFTMSPGLGEYISNYTNQNINVDEQIQFRFSGSVIDVNKIGSSVSTNIFSINPSVPGKAYWKDAATLIFEPEELLDYDKDYDIEIQLKRLFTDVRDEYKTVSLTYHTNPLNLHVQLNEIDYGSGADDNFLSVSGKLNANNAITDGDVEKLLTISQVGNDQLTINWNHHSTKNRRFTIENIERKNTESKVSVSWDASKYNPSQKGSREISILPRGFFKVVNAVIDESDNRSIVVSFSDQLDRGQDLIGLITIPDYDGKLKIDKAGSKLRIHADQNLPSSFSLVISNDVKRADGSKLKEGSTVELSLEPLKPSLKLIGQGVIVPDADEIIFPFLASNLNSATVEIYKIYQDNVLQYMQYGQLNQNGDRNTVGKVIHREKINLYDYSDNESAEERRIALNIKDFIVTDPGAIYQIRVGFDQSDISSYDCDAGEEDTFVFQFEEDSYDDGRSILDYRGYSDWSNRENPCSRDYYQPQKYINRNVLASNLGIIAKQGTDNTTTVAITDLKSINALSGVEIMYYDFQKQKIGSSTTDGSGMSTMKLDKEPSFLIARFNGTYGYLNLVDRYANTLSEFEVSGKTKRKGLDGMIYGERGVWRPGDTLFLNFILEDAAQSLPKDHPVKFEVIDSRSNKKYTSTTSNHLGHIYHFPVPTSAADPTGNWRAIATVGNQSFSKTLKIETVKPNRLKIDFEIPNDQLSLHDGGSLSMSSTWLHGAKANGLKAKVDVQLSAMPTTFKQYTDYVFDDPARQIEAVPINVFDAALDGNGEAQFKIKPLKNWLPAGKLKASIKTRVFEKSGNFSEDNISVPADLFATYVGIDIPKNRWGDNCISLGVDDKISFKTVNNDGQPIGNRKLSIGIYEARWNWWYDSGKYNRYKYNSAVHNGALVKDKISSDNNGEVEYTIDLEEDYGNYMIRVCDEVSGHCTGGMFYTGGYRMDQSERDGPQLLKFTTDKNEYEPGEMIKISIPSNEDAKIFLSVENGTKVLSASWVESQGDMTSIEIPCTQEMSPNVYIHATLVQKHSKKANDLPLRMYGLVPVNVIDPVTTLDPVITVNASVRPDEYFDIAVAEETGKSMYYTLAVVDEGLLGLTRFRTPDSWAHFYAKQALGVKTWDLYDLVLSGYGVEMDKLISIGGDAVSNIDVKGAKANRFKPVVKHLGPFHLKPGQKAKHKLKLSNYVGAVRAMVVARDQQKYGIADETIVVKKPLMVQATLPRVLGPGESLAVPANVFAMEDNIKNVNVEFESSGLMSLIGSKVNRLSFNEQGDKLSAFDIKVGNEIGVSKVKLSATSGKESSSDEIEIEIRNPNPVTTSVTEKSIPAGESWQKMMDIFGTPGTNTAVLEVSNMLPINLDKRLKYLIRYPYGCIEQTTSSVFPQLHLSELSDLTSDKIFEIEKNVQRGIERLSIFQNHDGGLSYWPGNRESSDWGSIYAFHFLIEAKEKGYFIPKNLVDKLASYLTTTAKNYKKDTYRSYHRFGLSQAYKLYALAKYGAPEIGAMNRLRNEEKLSSPSRHLLATAYAMIGQKDVARTLLADTSVDIKPYRETGYGYGSQLRDQAIILECLTELGDEEQAYDMVNLISKELNADRWFSTQSTAFALLSVGKFLGKHPKGKLDFSWSAAQVSNQKVTSTKPIATLDLDVEYGRENKVQVTNNSEGVLYAKVIVSGQAAPGVNDLASSKHLSMDVRYKTLEGNPIDVSRIKQGTDMMVEVDIKNLSTRGHNIEEVVLTQIFPSGWEIQNLRMSDTDNLMKESNYEYRDIRDDRVNTFFDIRGKESIKFVTLLTATYAGRFYMPGTYVEAMYDNEIQAKSKGQWIEVVK